MNSKQSVAIIGAGKVGTVLAQLAVRAGYTVYIAGSGDASKIALSMKVLVPGAIATTAIEAARKADIGIVAVPLSKYSRLPKDLFAGKILIDAMNYWWEVDGPLEDIYDTTMTSSEAVQAYFTQAKVVKAFNHMGYHDLYDYADRKDGSARKAIAVAGNTADGVRIVSQFIDSLGFTPYEAGPLKVGKKFEPGGPIFGASVDANMLRHLLS